MPLKNLFRPPHLKRFLAALAAGAAAMLVYVSAEHFQVVPGTGALDDPAPAPLTLGIRSIAVIPLVRENDTLVPGMTLGLIDRLARVRDVEVIAPRSALIAAQSLTPGLPRELPFGVAWVLEIASAGEEEDYRIAAGLFRSGEELPDWALERSLEIGGTARIIEETMDALARRVGFEPEAPAPADGNIGGRAFRNFLRARFLSMTGPGGVEEARSLLESVVQEHPGWAPAHAEYAYALLLSAAAGGDAVADDIERARGALEEARGLDPDGVRSHLYSSLLAHRFDWDWDAARRNAEAALAVSPGDAAVLAAASTAAFTLGDFERGEGQLRRAVALDPLVLSHRLKYGLMLEFAGRPQAAIDAYRELMEIDPDFPGGHAYLGRTLLVAGMPDSALSHMKIERDPFWRMYGMSLVTSALDRDDEAERLLQRLTEDFGHEAAVQIAEIQAFRGHVDEAFDWLDRAVAQRDPGLASLVGNPLFENLRGDERWADLLARLGLQES